MDEDFEQELYEEPDYNVWETNRVYEDMALEREEHEAEVEEAEDRAVLTAVVRDALAHREYEDFAPIWSDVVDEVVRALMEAGVEAPNLRQDPELDELQRMYREAEDEA